MKSKWKLNFINSKLLNKKSINLKTRSQKIYNIFLNSKFLIHNGKDYFEVTIGSIHLNNKLGKYSISRKKYNSDKKKKIKRR